MSHEIPVPAAGQPEFARKLTEYDLDLYISGLKRLTSEKYPKTEGIVKQLARRLKEAEAIVREYRALHDNVAGERGGFESTCACSTCRKADEELK